MAKLHVLIGEHVGVADGEDELEVRIGIETDHGPWVTALAAAGYVVFAVNPLQAARYRERHVVSGAKSDTGDSHILAGMVRTDAHQLRPVADDTEEAQAVKVVARAHKTLIWERNRQADRLRYQQRDFFPAALDAYGGLGLDSADVLELLGKAPDSAAAAKLTTARQPPRRHPARLPQNPDPLRRGNRLASKRQAISPSGLTPLTPGMSPKTERRR
jgi:hypothetical protein